MPLSDEERALFGAADNVIALPRAAAAQVTKPDQAGQAVQLSQKTGFPASVIGADLETFNAVNKGQAAASAIEGNQFISRYIAGNPMAAQVSSDDYDNLNILSKKVERFTIAGRQGGLLQAIPDFFLNSVPATYDLLMTTAGREKIRQNYPKVLEHLASPLLLPGDAAKQGFDIHDPADMERAQGLGLLVGLAKQSPKVGLADPLKGEIGPTRLSSPAEIDRFLIDTIMTKGQDPKTVLMIEHAKADSAALDQAIVAASNSATKTRAPSMVEEFIKGHGDEPIQLPANAIADLYRAEGKTPAPDDGLFGFVPDLARQLPLAVEAGTEITVPSSKYIAHVDPAVHDKIKDFIRVRPDGATPAEAKELEPKLEGIELYHGALAPTEIGFGTHLGTQEAANQRIGELMATDQISRPILAPKYGEEAPNITKVRLQEGKAVELKDRGDWDTEELAEQLATQGVLPRAEYDALEANDFMNFDPMQYLRDKGYDYVKYENINEDPGSTSYIVLNPDKVKGGWLPPFKAAVAEVNQALGLKPLLQTKPETGMAEQPGGEAIQGTTPKAMFSEPPPGMTKAEFDRYNKRIAEVQEKILDSATAQVERLRDAKQTKEWKATEAAVRGEVEAQVLQRPDIAAERWVKGGKIKLDQAEIESVVGKDNAIPAMMKAEGGVPADDVAPFAGFNSGKAMIEAINNLAAERKVSGESPRKQIDRLINEETARRMEAEHGDFGRKIAEEARELALADAHFDILSSEVRALAQEAGGVPPLSKDDLKTWAAGQFAALDTKTAGGYRTFEAAAGRAGKEAEKALMTGDVQEAFAAKLRQTKAWLLAKESNKFLKEVGKMADKVDRVMGAKEIASLDQAHLEHLQSMLAGIGFTPKMPLKAEQASLQQFVNESNGQLAVAHWLQTGAVRPGDPSKLTVEQTRELHKSIDSMLHVGRATKKLDSARGKAELENVVVDIVAELERFPFIEQPANSFRPNRMAKYVAAWNLLVEKMLDYTDQFNPQGPLATYLDRPLRESFAREIVLREKVTKKLRDLSELTDTSITDYIPNQVIPSNRMESGFFDLNRKNLRQLMGYMGSRSGIKKVTEGFGVKEEDVWKLINDNATKADWQWVAGMHEIFEMLWAESAAMQERVTGVVADRIEPLTMKSDKYGNFPGGYWPIKYDRFDSNIAGDLALKGDLFDPHYVAAVTPQAYTLPRTNYKGALNLDGNLGVSHIQGIIHDIAFREAVLNGNKLISNKDFMTAMRQRWGEEFADLMPGWLRDIANANRVDDAYAQGVVRALSLIRQNMTAALIAWNPGTFLKHGTTALGMSVPAVGLKNFTGSMYDFGFRGMIQASKDIIKGQADRTGLPEGALLDAVKAVTDPTEYGDGVRQFILDSSPLMRNRQRQAMDNVREAYQANVRAGWKQLAWDLRGVALDIGRVPIAASDALSSFPTWLAAYRDIMDKTGDHAQAVFEADRQVARTHGSNFIGDKPLSLRVGGNTLGGEMVRWITPLYNFFNHNFNMALQWAWDAKAWAQGKDEPGADIRSLSNRFFWGFMMAVVIEELAHPPLHEDKRYGPVTRMALAGVRHVGAWLPGLRDFTNAIAGGYEPSTGFLTMLSKNLYQTGQDIKKSLEGKQVSRNWFTHLATTLAFATGVGGAQFGRTGTYIKNRMTGAERPPRTWTELRQGLRTGTSKPRIVK